MNIKRSMQLISLCIITLFVITPFANGVNEEANICITSEVHFPRSYYEIQGGDSLTVLYPRSSIPVFVTKDDSFVIQFQSYSFDQVYASIETAYDALPDTIPLTIQSIEQNDQIYYVHAHIPVDTPEELYNLTVTITSEEQSFTQTRPRAVSVKQTIDDTFTFIQVADFHIGDPRGLKENPQEIFGWKASRRIIQEINLLQPDFVIISGDLTFGQLYPFEYTYEYKKCYEILQEFQVPTFLSPGNHDGYVQTGQDGFKFWETYFGPLYYSFDYGDYHFLSVNSYDWPKIARIGFSYLVFNWGGSIQEDQLSWIRQDVEKHQEMHLCMNLHHNPLWDTTSDSLVGKGYYSREELLDIIIENQFDAVFAGHVHFDNVTLKEDTLFITTTTASSGLDHDDSYWGYRLIQVENNTITSVNYKEPKYSIPSYHLNYSFSSDKSIVIENDLDSDVSVIVEFVTSFGYYNVQNGEIVQIRQKEDRAAYYVSAIIPANTEQSIMLL